MISEAIPSSKEGYFKIRPSRCSEGHLEVQIKLRLRDFKRNKAEARNSRSRTPSIQAGPEFGICDLEFALLLPRTGRPFVLI